jgi:DNA-binding Lrp family transcriptional regulator
MRIASYIPAVEICRIGNTYSIGETFPLFNARPARRREANSFCRVILTGHSDGTVKRDDMLDDIDKKLLAALQKDAHLTAQQLGDLLHLSPSQAGRRRQRLEADGYIQSYAARHDPARLGLHVQGFVQVQLGSHGPEQSASFARLVRTHPEITNVWTMTGDADYLLRVYCADLSGLNRLLHEVLLVHPAVARVHSQIVMDELKRDAPLPT